MITIQGAAAEIRWGYQRAAILGSWTLIDGAFTATVVSVDTFRVAQSPLTVAIGSIVRPVTELQIAGGTLTASLRPQESADGVAVRSS